MIHLSQEKDPGRLDFVGRSFSGLRLSRSVLSMTGASTRSRFRDCVFEDVIADDCHVGHAVFERCRFRNLVSRHTVRLHDALFIECVFERRMSHLNFATLRLPGPFFSEARWSGDQAAMEASAFAIDISAAESVVECSFVGATLARKIRFRPDQGFLVRGENLHEVLGPLQRATTNPDLAVTLVNPAGFGSSGNVHFCAIPAQATSRRDEFVAIVRAAGVEVVELPLV